MTTQTIVVLAADSAGGIVNVELENVARTDVYGHGGDGRYSFQFEDAQGTIIGRFPAESVLGWWDAASGTAKKGSSRSAS